MLFQMFADVTFTFNLQRDSPSYRSLIVLPCLGNRFSFQQIFSFQMNRLWYFPLYSGKLKKTIWYPEKLNNFPNKNKSDSWKYVMQNPEWCSVLKCLNLEGRERRVGRVYRLAFRKLWGFFFHFDFLTKFKIWTVTKNQNN